MFSAWFLCAAASMSLASFSGCLVSSFSSAAFARGVLSTHRRKRSLGGGWSPGACSVQSWWEADVGCEDICQFKCSTIVAYGRLVRHCENEQAGLSWLTPPISSHRSLRCWHHSRYKKLTTFASPNINAQNLFLFNRSVWRVSRSWMTGITCREVVVWQEHNNFFTCITCMVSLPKSNNF